MATRRTQPGRGCKRIRSLDELGSLWSTETAPKRLQATEEEEEADDLPPASAWAQLETRRERRFWRALPRAAQLDYTQKWDRLRKAHTQLPPYKYRILQLAVPQHVQLDALTRLEQVRQSEDQADTAKVRDWLEGLLRIPFDTYIHHTVPHTGIADHLTHVKRTMDQAVYGHSEAKESILHLVAQGLANPAATPHILGIQGPMGNGKTTLVREGVAKALNRPFVQISLGGASDVAFLHGHSYTYEGSRWGKLVDILMESRCMNPIVYFDELDKLSTSEKGQEIANLLIHLTDDSQNHAYVDRYFSNIELDLSRALFIFSFNDEQAINPILKDRLTIIRTRPLQRDDKLHILRDYLLPRTQRNLGFAPEDVTLPDESYQALLEMAPPEQGVRQLKQLLECVLLRILTLTISPGDHEFMRCMPATLHGVRLQRPVRLRRDLLAKLVRHQPPPAHLHMYT